MIITVALLGIASTIPPDSINLTIASKVRSPLYSIA